MRRLHGVSTAVSLLALLALPAAILTSSTHPAAAAYAVDVPKFDVRKPPAGTRVNVEAAQLTYNSDTKVAVATGEVVLTYGPYLLVAKKVTYDQAKDIMQAEGEIRLREPDGNILVADVAELRNKFRDGFAEHLRLLLTNDATVTAEYAKRSNGVVTVYTRATYTRCKTCVTSDGTPLWEIKSAEATHDQDAHRIYHRDMTFDVLGLPVLYAPWFSHPDGTLKNQSGFLTPNYRYESDFGNALELPVEIALNPSYDLALLPLITQKQGVMPRAIWRQRLGSGSYDIDAAGIYENNPNPAAPGSRWRGYARTTGKFDLNSRWSWGWDGTLQSDDTFARHYGVNDRTVDTDQIYLTGIDDRNYFSARAMHFQVLTETSDQNTQPVALPYIEHSYTFDHPVAGGEFGIDSSFYDLARKDFINETASATDLFQSTRQTRASTAAHWQEQLVSSGGLVVTPFTRLRADVYNNAEIANALTGVEEDGQTTARLLPTAGADVRMPFVKGTDSGEHVLTPVAQFISASDETDRNLIGNEDAIALDFDHTSLFLQDRFTGLDRFEAGTRINSGLLYSFLAPGGGFLRASIGESFHIAGENSFTTGSGLEGARSDVVAALALQPWNGFRLSYQARLDNQSLGLVSQQASFNTIFDRFSLTGGLADLDAEPAYGRTSGERQVWAAGSFQLHGPWSLFAGAHYDYASDFMIRDYVGIGFDCDCMNMKLYYTEDHQTDRDITAEHAVMFSIEFKTLGSVGRTPKL